jgi:hypothetical protein
MRRNVILLYKKTQPMDNPRETMRYRISMIL